MKHQLQNNFKDDGGGSTMNFDQLFKKGSYVSIYWDRKHGKRKPTRSTWEG